MSIPQFLKANPPVAICTLCQNPLIHKEDTDKGQIVYCRFCHLETKLQKSATVDYIKSPFGNMLVSISQIARTTPKDEDNG